MAKKPYEIECGETVNAAVKRALAAASAEGFRVGAIIQKANGDRYRLTRVGMYLGAAFGQQEGRQTAFLSMRGAKLLRSGDWGTHSHSLHLGEGLIVIGQANSN